MERVRWEDLVEMCLALCLAFSALLASTLSIKPISHLASMNLGVVGVLLFICAATALRARSAWHDWLYLALALWLAVSPWILQTSDEQLAKWIGFAFAFFVGIIAGSALAEDTGRVSL